MKNLLMTLYKVRFSFKDSVHALVYPPQKYLFMSHFLLMRDLLI